MKCSRRFAIATAADVAARREGLLLWVSLGLVTILRSRSVLFTPLYSSWTARTHNGRWRSTLQFQNWVCMAITGTASLTPCLMARKSGTPASHSSSSFSSAFSVAQFGSLTPTEYNSLCIRPWRIAKNQSVPD